MLQISCEISLYSLKPNPRLIQYFHILTEAQNQDDFFNTRLMISQQFGFLVVLRAIHALLRTDNLVYPILLNI